MAQQQQQGGGWNDYICSLKAPCNGKDVIDEVAICGYKDGCEGVWACTPNMSNIPKETICCLANDRKDLPMKGIHIGGVKCRMIRDLLDDEIHLLDMKTAADAEGNTYGVCVGKTNNAIIIAKGCKDAPGGQVNNQVGKMVEYLRKCNM